jgi:hypothetical protein
MNFSDPVTAAMIGAGATVLTALVQLRTSWRKELNERERGQPITKKTRRGPVLAVAALLIAAAVGGFALSQYLLSLREGDSATLRNELQTRLAEISASAARLEQARLDDRSQVESTIRRAEALRQGELGASATVMVEPCQRTGSAASETQRGCAEQEATRIAVCAAVPAAASVTEVQLYARLEDSPQSWPDSRAVAEQDIGQAKFVDKVFERAESENVKQVCQRFAHWNNEKPRIARIVVKYTL